jgi:hypothetical protein
MIAFLLTNVFNLVENMLTKNVKSENTPNNFIKVYYKCNSSDLEFK